MSGKIITPGVQTRAALYLRVSTGRQAVNDLSIPDQRRQLEAYCETKGWEATAEYVEPGNTATDDRRPSFQSMIEAALTKPPAFDVIVVHSFSRFFRDQFQFEFYVRKLAKNGVRLVSITQELGDDPMSMMMRQIMTLFDEYQSRENAKHTLRAMKENARQGFWNGARPPIGYRIVAAEQRGAKIKKTLEIDPLQAETVRTIYRWALTGDGSQGPMGLKTIATRLNERNIRTRDGGRWGIGTVHQILTRSTYMGEHRFNTRDHKTKASKPESEHAIMAVPPIVSKADYEAVRARLTLRNPRWTPPRVSTGPNLLTGICFCGVCGGAMTLRTGRGSTGGQYRYYACSTKARMGETGCTGLAVPMHKLDDAIIDHLETRLLDPDRLAALMEQLLDRREEWADQRRGHIAEMRKRATEAEAKLNRLYEAIENGLLAPDDASLKDRVAELSGTRDQARADAERISASVERLAPTITPDALARFATAARRKLRDRTSGYRRDHLRALTQRVEVISKTEARIIGSRTELLRALASSDGGSYAASGGVLSFERKWRTRQDSNL
ncbi:recombinase family protein [Brevundimonas vesicularis]|uniref:recombinase family protein n=1 Tax=Brevundimonas vesicularis TaxID=41276 RepID=UPI0022AC2625|nr:recombinase family protein [Brevundimonas vesicularis]